MRKLIREALAEVTERYAFAARGCRMSGGSFDYLYSKDTLVGESAQVKKMAQYCRDRADSLLAHNKSVEGENIPYTLRDKSNLFCVADEMEDLARWLKSVESRLLSTQRFYGDLLRAIEWSASGDTGPDDILKHYHKLMGVIE